MLQRYDISIDDDANRLLIREFAAIGRKLRKNDNYDIALEKFSLIHEVSYDIDIIRAAIEAGSEALISAFRSDNFFPISACAKIIAERITDLLNGNTEPVSELFFDDRTLLSSYNEHF
jgi:hypothetical protein